MSTAIKQIRERVEDILENITPGVSPAITLRRWLGSRDILTGEHTESAAKTTRQFQVVALPVRDPGFLGGGSVDQWQTLRITIRYYMSDRPDGWEDVHDLAAADSADIYEALMDDGQWVGTSAEGAALGDAVPLTASPTISSLGFQVLHYRVLYNRCNAGSGGTWTAHFYTLGALLAYLDTKPKGTAAKLANERTQEIIGVWVKDDIEGTWCDFSKADGTEFADGVDIISQGAGTWAITYGTGIVVSTDAAEFYGFARLANSDILGTGTTTIYTRAKIHTYTSQADIDAVTGTTDQVVALVGSDGSLTSHQRWNGSAWVVLEVAAGTAAIGYTDLSLLFASAGVDGARAALWERVNGTPLVWYRYLSEKGQWWPEQHRFSGLTAAEQAVWDTFVEAGSGAYTWTPEGIQFATADSRVKFIGLYPAGANPIRWALINTTLKAAMVVPTGGAAADRQTIAASTGWGASRTNRVGVLMEHYRSLTGVNVSGYCVAAGVALSVTAGPIGGGTVAGQIQDVAVVSGTGFDTSGASLISELIPGAGRVKNRTTLVESFESNWFDQLCGTFDEDTDLYGLELEYVRLLGVTGTATVSSVSTAWSEI
jgi:hypothetical protein